MTIKRFGHHLAGLFALLVLAVLMASPAAAIVDGAPDNGRHPYVALIFNESESCSGSAISPTVVVTASHCLQHPSGDRWSVLFTERYADATSADVIGAT